MRSGLTDVDAIKVRSRLYEKRMTQRDLADRLGVGEVTISRYLNGIRKPTKETVERIARILETVPENLEVYGEDGETPETALNRVRYLCETYKGEWSHNERISIVDVLMW